MMLLDGAPANAPAPARDARRPWALALARRYARYATRQRFDGVFVDGLDDVIARCAQGPVIFAANHVCWWDAFALVLVDAVCGTEGRVLMDEANLARLPFFKALGALPLSTTGGARVRRQLADAVDTLDRPGRTLWIFPQGRQRAWHLRPLGFAPGLALLARRAKVPVVPVSLAYPWRVAPKPSIVLRFGPAIVDVDHPSLVADVEHQVGAGLDAIDADIDAGAVPAAGTRVLVPPDTKRGAEDGLGARLLRRWLGGAP
jgi:1-acyl-sn-glycerol-3-phosphate acyltransferase